MTKMARAFFLCHHRSPLCALRRSRTLNPFGGSSLRVVCLTVVVAEGEVYITSHVLALSSGIFLFFLERVARARVGVALSNDLPLRIR